MAIAFLTGNGAQGVTNTHTASLNATGASILIATVWTVGDISTTVTFNGSENFTQIGSTYEYNTGEFLTIWYLVNPTSTTANVVASLGASIISAMRCMALSGTSTTGIPDSTANNAGGPGDSATGTTTSVADNSIGVMVARFETGSPTSTGGTNFTSTVPMGDTVGSFLILGYSALKTPAGSLQMIAKSSSAGDVWGVRILSLAPATVPVNSRFLNFMPN